MGRLPLLSVLLTALVSFSAGAHEITFKNHGQLVKTLSLDALKKLIPTKSLKVKDPNESAEITFQGLAVNALFEQIYGKDWNKSEMVLFTCLDGYQPSVPTEMLRKNEGYFAFERTGSKSFFILNKAENKKADIAPLYLIWNNFGANKDAEVNEGSLWPYELSTIDLTSFNELFPKISPPAKASAKVKNGFSLFRSKCLICHTVNGDGGKSAPELNYPVSVTEYYKEDMLKKWIDNPQNIRFKTPMPPPQFSSGVDRQKAISDIIGYLKVMAHNKIKPEEKK